jgi:hypothetical protein
MACLRLMLICVLLLLPAQALSQEGSRFERLSPASPGSIRNLTIKPVLPSEEPVQLPKFGFPSLPDLAGVPARGNLNALHDLLPIALLEAELAVRCRLHGLDLYPTKWDGITAISVRLTEYDRLLRGSNLTTPTSSKLNDACRDLLRVVRFGALNQSIRKTSISVASIKRQ